MLAVPIFRKTQSKRRENKDEDVGRFYECKNAGQCPLESIESWQVGWGMPVSRSQKPLSIPR
jgi:hypothetical protein